MHNPIFLIDLPTFHAKNHFLRRASMDFFFLLETSFVHNQLNIDAAGMFFFSYITLPNCIIIFHMHNPIFLIDLPTFHAKNQDRRSNGLAMRV